MATFLPSSGAISISDINGVFGRGNNLSVYRGTSYYTVAGGATDFSFSSGAISIGDFYGTGPSPNFTLAFNNGVDFYIQSVNNFGTTTATITINTDGSITKYGVYDAAGPTAWGSPLTGGIGSSYEFRVVMSSVYTDSGSSFTVAGVDYTSTTTTPWYTISSNRLIEAYSYYYESISSGTIEIRNISTLATISRGYYMRAAGDAP
jgi:hypothetical protein